MMTLTGVVSSFAMGTTIFIGQMIGAKKPREAGQIVGSGLLFFFAVGIVLTALIPAGARPLALIMHAPKEAVSLTTAYIRICRAGFVVIIAYNLIGSIFRGLGDSKTPLFTVAVACVCNIAGDRLIFHEQDQAGISVPRWTGYAVLHRCSDIALFRLHDTYPKETRGR